MKTTMTIKEAEYLLNTFLSPKDMSGNQHSLMVEILASKPPECLVASTKTTADHSVDANKMAPTKPLTLAALCETLEGLNQVLQMLGQFRYDNSQGEIKNRMDWLTDYLKGATK